MTALLPPLLTRGWGATLRIKRFSFALVALIELLCTAVIVKGEVSRWQSVELWNTKTITARFFYLSPSSLADDKIFSIELNNPRGKAISLTQGWLNVVTTTCSASTGEAISSGGFSGGGLPVGPLALGINQLAFGNSEDAAGDFGLPSRGGNLIKLTVRCDATLSDGEHVSTPYGGIRLQLQWRYPSPREIEDSKKKLRPLLVHPEHTFAHDAALYRLLLIPEVANSLSVDELLHALDDRTDSVDGRNLIVIQIALRFNRDPKVISYYVERLRTGDRLALFDLEGCIQLWSPAWIDPLVADFEHGGDSGILRTLSYHRADWADSLEVVSRLSAALLLFRPLLHETVASIPTSQLADWKTSVQEAALIGNKEFIRRLSPSLDDHRVIHDTALTSMLKPPESRVCDAALLAVLTLLDGRPELAFQKAGLNVPLWEHNDKLRFSTFDRVIALTKRRIGE